MKTETPRLRATITDRDRDSVIRLAECGLTVEETVDAMHIGKSTVAYIRQAHKAARLRDWSTLQKLSTSYRATTDWAMRVTGADKEFEQTFSKEPEHGEPCSVVVEPPISRDDVDYLKQSLSDIRNLLVEIRDMLK